MAGCTPRYVVPLSDSYSQDQFSKLSKGYEKTVGTIHGEEIPFDEVHIRNHTVYIISKDSSEIKRLFLFRRFAQLTWFHIHNWFRDC